MRFKLLGTEIYISFLFAAVITLMLACDRTGLVLPTLFAVFVHEIGHLFAMWLLECGPKRIKLIPTSMQITAPITKRYRNDILIALFGPLVNFLFTLIFYLNFMLFKNELSFYYAGLNLIIGLFNSLPVSGLDGGTVLYSVISKKTNPNRAAVIMKFITFGVASILTATAIILTLKGSFNVSLYIIGIYLFVMAVTCK